MTSPEREAERSDAPSLAKRAITFELGIWLSLYRLITRRPRVAPGAEWFGYAKAVEPVIWVFIVVSAIEVVVVHLLLPWPVVRTIALILGAWGLTWMVGMLASVKVNVHQLSPAGIRIRYGGSVDVTVPWEAVQSIRPYRQDLPSSRTVQLDQTSDGTVLKIGVSSQTNVHIRLRQPITVRLPKGEQTIVELRCYADDSREFVTRARTYFP